MLHGSVPHINFVFAVFLVHFLSGCNLLNMAAFRDGPARCRACLLTPGEWVHRCGLGGPELSLDTLLKVKLFAIQLANDCNGLVVDTSVEIIAVGKKKLKKWVLLHRLPEPRECNFDLCLKCLEIQSQAPQCRVSRVSAWLPGCLVSRVSSGAPFVCQNFFCFPRYCR